MNEESIQELLNAGKALGTPINIPGYEVGVLTPEGYTFTALDFRDPDPVLPYVKQSVSLSDAESFIAYVLRYQSIDTVLFSTLPQQDGNGAEFRAVFDYHQGGKGNEVKANRAAHHAVFPCPLSVNWKAWAGVSGKGMSQEAFVNFIEANTPDIVSPNAADLMELAINFESKTEVEFLSKMDRSSGTRKLLFNEIVTNGSKKEGSIAVPDQLKLKLPTFEGGKSFDLSVRLEWKASSGKLTVTLHLLRPYEVIRLALTDLRSEIEAGTSLAPMVGKLL